VKNLGVMQMSEPSGAFLDLQIQAPGGQYIHTEKVKLEAIRDEKVTRVFNSVTTKYEATINFTAVEKGRYNICFHNRGNVVETVKLDIYHAGVDHEEPVKDGEYPLPT